MQKAQFVGITSRIPSSKKHYLLLDIDGGRGIFHFDLARFKMELLWFLNLGLDTRTKFYPTRHGWHGVVFHAFTFKQICELMPQIPYLDQKWFEIGKERGYWFLISYEPLISTPEHPLSYMRITWDGKGGAEWVKEKLQKS